MKDRFSHLRGKLSEIRESKDPSNEEMQKQIKALSGMLSELMNFLDGDLAIELQKELEQKHRLRS